ncbi:CocE/NonD family hydrolase [Streptomyces sp. NPDC005728]|uniref:alpha/beta hydrolase n=1 Tax=Streptomyces sp. NPDC005728 TaxID=3157054 RepID=UPI0033F3186B
MALLRLAATFAGAGFVALDHDHRTFGASDGTPRQDIAPWKQIEDWRRAIAYLESRPEVDADRIGLWGSSYAGGHAIVLGATDRRLKAVVAQVPTISGFEQSRRRVAPDDVPALEAALDADERAQLAGEAPRTQALASADPAVPASYRAQDAVDFYLQELPEGTRWDNTVTVRSTRNARMYEPGVFIDRISPHPAADDRREAGHRHPHRHRTRRLQPSAATKGAGDAPRRALRPVHHRVRPRLGCGHRLLPQPPGTKRRLVRHYPQLQSVPEECARPTLPHFRR